MITTTTDRTPATPLTLAVDCLATYRLTRLLVQDELTAPFRELVWKHFSPEDTKIGYFLTCPHCASVWIGAGVVAARRTAPRSWDLLARALAFSTVAGLVAEHLA